MTGHANIRRTHPWGLYIHQLLHRCGAEYVAHFCVNKLIVKKLQYQLKNRRSGDGNHNIKKRVGSKWQLALANLAMYHWLQVAEGAIMINTKNLKKQKPEGSKI